MANPQKEDGYTPISNEILNALGRVRIPGEANQVLYVIIRQTYGFQKKEDQIALSQFCEKTGMQKPDVCRALAKLLTMNIIVSKKANDKYGITAYGLNKNYEEWKPLAKKRLLAIKPIIVGNKANRVLAIKPHTKETITKERKKYAETSSAAPKSKKNDPKKDIRPLNLSEFLEKMRSSPHRYINLIGEYADQVQPNFTTRGQWHVFTTRNVRSASQLAPFSDDQITNAFTKIRSNIRSRDNPKGYITKWTLETLLDYIHEK